MSLTRAFEAEEGQMVRIPADLAYADVQQDLRITRSGDVLMISPARLSLRVAVAELRALPKPPEPALREPIEVPDRPGL